MRDEIMIERLSTAHDMEMSRNSNGIYDFSPCCLDEPEPMSPDEWLRKIQGPSAARVVSTDEWNLILSHMTDEEKAAIEYER